MLRSDGVNFEDERVNYRDDGGEFFVKKRDARCAGFDFLRGEYYRSRFLGELLKALLADVLDGRSDYALPEMWEDSRRIDWD